MHRDTFQLLGSKRTHLLHEDCRATLTIAIASAVPWKCSLIFRASESMTMCERCCDRAAYDHTYSCTICELLKQIVNRKLDEHTKYT